MLIARLPDPSSGQVLEVNVPLDDSGLPHAGDCCCAQCQAQPVQAISAHSSLDLSSPVPAVSPCACAMVVSVFQGTLPELVHTPFLVVHHESFVVGYACGADAYFEEVWDEEHDRKGRELTDDVLIEELGTIIFEDTRFVSREEREEWLAWIAGFLAGFISARIPSAFPLYGNCCRCHQPLLACGHCPRCASPAHGVHCEHGGEGSHER
jgi:hypothetical protein